MAIIVPGIGYAGLGQQTQANQLVFRQGMGARAGGTTRRRKSSRKKKAAAPRAKRRKVRASGKRGGGKFTKGSAAAKRHMAKLRKMRKR